MNVTAFLAHPDDELMCAGTLARLAAGGDEVYIRTLFMDERLPEWRAAYRALGIQGVGVGFSYDEDEFVWSRKTVREIEDERCLHATDLWITHRSDDDNTSHGHIGRLVRTLARKNYASVWEIDQSLPGGVVPGGPNVFVNISDYRHEKAAAVSSYPSQLARYPGMAEAIEYRDRLYGWEIGVDAAEGFTVRKTVIL